MEKLIVPYIPQNKRPPLDIIVRQMADVKPNGELNYLLFAYALRNIKPSYNNYKELIGELNCAIEEIRRRLLDPYEDLKIKENGDVEK